MDAGVPTSMQKLMFKGLYNLLHSFLLIHNQIWLLCLIIIFKGLIGATISKIYKNRTMAASWQKN